MADYQTQYERTRRMIESLSNNARSSVAERDFVSAKSYIEEARIMENRYRQGVEETGAKVDIRETIELNKIIIDAENLILKETVFKQTPPVQPRLKQIQIMTLESKD